MSNGDEVTYDILTKCYKYKGFSATKILIDGGIDTTWIDDDVFETHEVKGIGIEKFKEMVDIKMKTTSPKGDLNGKRL